MSKDKGGPAFPVVHDIEPKVGMARSISVDSGMTLRDYFAAKAIQGMASNQNWNITKQIENFARESYAIADAMLAERNKGE